MLIKIVLCYCRIW